MIPSMSKAPALTNRLKTLREERKWTLRHVAELAGMSFGMYVKVENGDRRLNQEKMEHFATIFGVTPAEIINTDAACPVVARIVNEAGPRLVSLPEDSELASVPLPPGSTASTVAAVVDMGDALQGPWMNGWLVYYDDVFGSVNDSTEGELCVVTLRDGSRVMRAPVPAREEGHFDLECIGCATLRDVPVKSVSLVTWIASRRCLTERRPAPAPSGKKRGRPPMALKLVEAES